MNTKPVTVVGIAPKGFYGDRMTTSPPAFYLPMHQVETIQGNYVDHPDEMWLYIVGRVKPGVNRAALQTKLNGCYGSFLRQAKTFPRCMTRIC